MMRHVTMLTACLALAACGSGGGGGDSSNNEAVAPANQSSAGGEVKGPATPSASVFAMLAGSADHATLVNAVKAAGLERTLSGTQPYTLFAPTEAAFQKLPAGMANGLLEPDSKGQLTALLTGHIVQGTVTAEDLNRAIERGKGKAQLATVAGTTLTFSKQGDALLLTDANGGQARVVTPGQTASNGVVHGIDAVLMPK